MIRNRSLQCRYANRFRAVDTGVIEVVRRPIMLGHRIRLGAERLRIQTFSSFLYKWEGTEAGKKEDI